MSKCYVCDSEYSLSNHHVYGGRNRKLSEKYDALVPLCFSCHRLVHDQLSQKLNNQLKLEFQLSIEQVFMDIYECEQESARDRFILEFGRNYDL